MPAHPSSPTCAAIIVAAGSSRRMGFDKLAAPLYGAPVLRRTVDAFLAAQSVTSIVIVCPEDRWSLLDPAAFAKPVLRVDGGADRQNSVENGLAAIPAGTELVAVHDGARPLVPPDDIDRCVRAAAEHRAATLARRVTETVKRSDCEDFSAGSVSRENLWSMETPQVFMVPLLMEAYRNVTARGLTVTDEVSAVQSIGGRVKFVESRRHNPKITHPEDLALAEALLKLNP